MFLQLFLFEIKYRLKRPEVYISFLVFFVFSVFSFSVGALPVMEKEYINGPSLLTFVVSFLSMFMMLVSSAIMGTPLYRDIEHNTREYYLSYPLTKAGYFWGRYLGSFVFVLLIASSLLWGAYLGTFLGPAFGWQEASRYGPNHFINYLYPYLVFALPNLFFTSSIFFGLVALNRNVKVIYSSGIILFLSYSLGTFFLMRTNNTTLMHLADPFAVNAVRMERRFSDVSQLNTSLIPLQGMFLINRILWPSLGLLILMFTFLRFNFEDFIANRTNKKLTQNQVKAHSSGRMPIPLVAASFTGKYPLKTLYTLTRIEWLSIMRDNYFWIILSGLTLFLAFIFWEGPGNYGIPDFPRTVMLINIFNEGFPIFIFIILIFYTGETLHREKVSHFAFINDALPPPTWVLYGSKLLSLFGLAFFLALLPWLTGLCIQLAKGYTQFNLAMYLSAFFTLHLPMFIQMVMLSFMVHVCINHKFAAHGIGISIWTLMMLVHSTGYFDYLLLLYARMPFYVISDMDGLGHMAKPVFWLNLHWLLTGGLFLVLAALLYNRGLHSSFKERLQVARHRFNRQTKVASFVLFLAFMASGSYIYYNVSYVNNYLTRSEREARIAAYENQLKRYENMPLPKITALQLQVDLFPENRKAIVKGQLTLVNKTNQPISALFLDGERLKSYSIKYNGASIPFTSPLIHERGIFNFFRPRQDTTQYRIYQFSQPLIPGDSALLEVNSLVAYEGFSNYVDGAEMLYNGTFFDGGLPNMGYNANNELRGDDRRKKYNLPQRIDKEIPQDDSSGVRTLLSGKTADLMQVNITVSTSQEQVAVAPGKLQKEWKENGRNYYQYVNEGKGMYMPLAIASARFAILKDSVQLKNGRYIKIELYYHPSHQANLNRFIAGYKDGLHYYSGKYGTYPFDHIRLVESSMYASRLSSYAGMDALTEMMGWNADFDDPLQMDYCYFITARQLSKQWWGSQVAPNQTAGSKVISEGISKYDALLLMEKKYGDLHIRNMLGGELFNYLLRRRWENPSEAALVKANGQGKWDNKAGFVMYGLKDLVGEEPLNRALMEFKNAYAFVDTPPYAGSNDLYRIIQKNTPDSLQYYLTDTWQKITFYDNKVLEAKATPLGKNKGYKVEMKVKVNKVYSDSTKVEKNATQMNDYIDIGIFASDSISKDGSKLSNPLYLHKHKLTAGEHTFDIIVKEKPVKVGIDPYIKLIDRIAHDNVKDL